MLEVNVYDRKIREKSAFFKLELKGLKRINMQENA